jgi:periplasmic glucans biosynthesis protein
MAARPLSLFLQPTADFRRTMKLNRRQTLLVASASALAAMFDRRIVRAAAAAGEIRFGPAQPFDFEWLKAKAQALAAQPYQEPVIRHADILETIDYDAYQQIRFQPERALWEAGGAPFPVQFFHLGRFFKAPVSLHEVANGQARQILYATDYFVFGKTGLDAKLPGDLGFAGFRVMDGRGLPTDWLAYQGAAYFRTSGALNQYGLSARGLAIDTAMPWPEEFPRFTQFWLERTPEDSARILIYALMDSPSVAGAYRFDWVKNEGAVADIQAELFCRKDIARMGVAPLTSMFWYAENNRHLATDWRPEIHDSDGLTIWTGAGERIWRPLNNPPTVRTSSFVDDSPKGFGLLQRDRAFYHYEDDGVFYDRRPSVWIEPLAGWGRGAVQLVEIPTDDEIHDNIVAYWLPADAVKAGSKWSFGYKLHWLADEPYPPTAVARVRHTRTGRGGIPGQPRPEGARKFVIDFEGGPLVDLEKLDEVKPVIETSRGRIDNAYALQIVGTRNWRAFFDLYADGPDPVELRCFLRLAERTLTETWLYQYIPFEYKQI